MKIRLVGEAAQTALGRRIATHLQPPCVLYLEGDLGTGKTTLVRGVLRGLGHEGPARSPTYTLLETYDLARLRLFHLDLYRLADPGELEYLGLRDLLEADSVLFVEWPERGAGELPGADLLIRIDHAGDARDLHIEARTPSGERLRAAVAAQGDPSGR